MPLLSVVVITKDEGGSKIFAKGDTTIFCGCDH
jgi:hypothetical protein